MPIKKFKSKLMVGATLVGLMQQPLFAQVSATIEIVGEDNKPAEYAVIIFPELKKKFRVENGLVSILVPNEGRYRVTVQSPVYAQLDTETEIISQKPVRLKMKYRKQKAAAVFIRDSREKHNVSKHRLSRQELRSVPATMGDSISALATLPGIIRAGGIVGPLIIRGASDRANRYFIDDIPILNPQHFGGFQSVIANDLMHEIILYSSAFPAFYGQALGAVIDIKTIDEAVRRESLIQVGIISSNFFTKAPFSDEKNSGFYSLSGRVGYLSLAVPPIYKLVTGNEIAAVPEYYDYQFKAKWFLDENMKHSFKILSFGSYDTFTFIRKLSEEERKQRIEDGADPVSGDLNIKNDISSHSQGLFYEYKPSEQFRYKLAMYNTLVYSRYTREASGNNTGLIDVNARPDIAGIRNMFALSWLAGHAQAKAGVDYGLFYFSSSGQTQQQKGVIAAGAVVDLNNPDQFETVGISIKGTNHLVNAYAENRFEWGGFFITPGVRTDYLEKTNEQTLDYRGLVGYVFSWGTTLSFSGGTNSSFPQINPYLFNQANRRQSQAANATYLKSEKSLHRSAAVEQEVGLYSVKAEYFNNEYTDIIDNATSAAILAGRLYENSRMSKSQGFEILFRKSLYEDDDGFFGWISYTLSKADIFSEGRFIPYRFEQRHSLKAVGVVRSGANEFGIRFELYSGFPYTPIIGSQCDTSGGFTCTNEGNTRYVRITDVDNPYSAVYPFAHRLDVRYTRTSKYSWGSFSWFVEVINVYNYEPKIRQVWNYNRPYEPGVNPRLAGPSTPVNFIPNFGLEWRF